MRAPLALWLTGVAIGTFAVTAAAERRPARVYTVTDGLSSPYIKSIAQGTGGLLWVGSRNGLDRFDGVRFVRYGPENGLPDTTVNDVNVARDGSLWLGTNGGGIVHFDPSHYSEDPGAASERWTITRLPGGAIENRVNYVVEATDGRIWAGTDAGLFRERDVGSRTFDVVGFDGETAAPGISALFEDRAGVMWAGGTRTGLQSFGPDGVRREVIGGRLLDHVVLSILEDRERRVWAASRTGLARLERGSSGTSVVRVYDSRDGLPSSAVVGLLQTRDGTLWASTSGGLASFANGRFEAYPSDTIIDGPLLEDRDGNLWGGSPKGLVKIAPGGFSLFDDRDRPGLQRTMGFLRQPDGTLFSVSEDSSVCRLSDLATGRLPVPTWIGSRWLAQGGTIDRDGAWWLAGRDGLYRYPAPRTVDGSLRFGPPDLVLGPTSGVSGAVYRVFADSRGDVWIGFFDGPSPRLARWRRSTGIVERPALNLSLPPQATPWAFAEDRAGNIWIGFEQAALMRVASTGEVLTLRPEDGWPRSNVSSLRVDRLGRLWMGTIREGLWRIDAPDAPRPYAQRYTIDDGLLANDVRSLVDDAMGRIYVGTVRGMDRLDPDTGLIRHYATEDGLGSDYLTMSDRDDRGRLWFAALSGLARLEPRLDPVPTPPTVLIQGVTIGGNAQPLAETGVPEVRAFNVDPGTTPIRLDFLALTLRPGDRMRYRYRLTGTDWQPAGDERFVTFASLSPGSYTFEVEATNAGGLASPRPATVRFRVLAPIWQRWWFLLGVGVVLAAALASAHQLRVARLMAIERLRTRIARDLHDDIGSGLTHVVLLNELIERRAVDKESADLTNRLRNATVDMTEALGDIVWALSPTHVRASDLVHRMRRFAGEVTAGAGLRLRFEADARVDVTLPIDVRRETYLVFKEALHNAVRHANCQTVSIHCVLGPGAFDLHVADDGCGMDPGRARAGHGLENMRARAARVGGQLTVDSQPGAGTRVTMQVPLRRLRAFRIPA